MDWIVIAAACGAYVLISKLSEISETLRRLEAFTKLYGKVNSLKEHSAAMDQFERDRHRVD